MKKIMTTVMALTLALGMSVTALAAPSPSQGVGSDEKDKVTVEILPGATLSDAEKALVDAWNAMDDTDDDKWNVSSETSIPTDVANAVEAAAATADKNASVVAYGEVNVSPDIAALVNAGKITVTVPMTLTGVTAADNGNVIALVYHDGKWDPMKTEVVGDGRVNVTFTHFSPVAFVQVTAKTSNDDSEQIPDTPGSSAGAQSPSVSGAVSGATDKNGASVSVSSTAIDPVSNEGKTIVAEAEAAAQKGIASYEEVHRIAQFEVECSAATPENPVTITFAIPAVAVNDKIVVMHKTASGWIQEKNVKITANGTVQVTVTSCSPFVFYKVTGYDGWAGVSASAKAEMMSATKTGATSPKTGDTGVIGFMLIAAACGAGLVYGKKKTI